ncbi:nitroreductase family protein [Dehalogenimonas sp. 4OHTPN]|uniref:Nitroreductase family protein n=1 Tax=Dehalogenimonas sp. 4OHTPN TaxID=3166643 RepID=A0AAU8G8Z3_9CHLR
MEFSEVISSRYSVRSYRPDTVPDDQLQKVLEAARLAPTAANRQPFKVLIIHTEGREAELQGIYPSEWFTQAPILLCVCALPDRGWERHDGKNYAEVDAAIVMDHIILAATSLGLGTCWVAAFDVPTARKVLRIPDEWQPIVFTPLGYAHSQLRPKSRRPLSELVVYDRPPR